MARTTQQLVDLLARHGVVLTRLQQGEASSEARVSAWLRDRAPGRAAPDPAAPGYHVHSVQLGSLGLSVSARYDWDTGRFVVRDWWVFNA